MQRTRHILGLILALWLSGCSLLHVPAPLPAGVPLSETEQAALMADLVAQLSDPYPPAKTKFRLTPKEEDALGQAFAASLRHAGYGVVSDALPNAPRIELQVGVVSADRVVVQLDVGAFYRYSRLYQRHGAQGLVPLGLPTVRRQE